jgi:hypothetical protein
MSRAFVQPCADPNLADAQFLVIKPETIQNSHSSIQDLNAISARE